MGQGDGVPVLVGRVEELAALDAAWERVGQGQPATVLVGGEAGVGKSRLAEEFGARAAGARAAGALRVLFGYCLDLSAEGLPFAAWALKIFNCECYDLVMTGAGCGMPEV